MELTINLNKYELIKDEIAFVLLNDTYSFKSENDSICCVIDIPYDSYLRIANNSMLSNGLKINKMSKKELNFDNKVIGITYSKKLTKQRPIN